MKRLTLFPGESFVVEYRISHIDGNVRSKKTDSKRGKEIISCVRASESIKETFTQNTQEA